MANKPFRSVNDQISILRSRGITIDDEVYASNFLINRNYYSMINDYGRFFTVTSDVYISGTTLKDINSVYLFDKAIKTILYTHSLEFEKYLKSTLAYYFCLQHPNSYDYLNINCYKHKSNKERLNAIDIISRTAKVIDDYSKKHNTNGIRHYSRVHTNIPLWVVIQFMYLGDVIKLYRCCEDSVQTDVAKMFSSFLISNTSMPNQILGTRELLTIMQNVRDFRNCVAHDNRILNMNSSNNLPYIPSIHSASTQRSNFRADLYNMVLIFQCLISADEYKNMIGAFKRRIKDLRRHITIIDYNKITCALGFPIDWINTI